MTGCNIFLHLLTVDIAVLIWFNSMERMDKMDRMDKRAIPTDISEYNKAKERVKASVKRWPNAYASGQVVQEYKRVMAAKGKPAYMADVQRDATALNRWYKEKWVDIKTGLPCGAVHTKTYYPTCRPSKKITSSTPVTLHELTPAQKGVRVAEKQKAKTRTVRALSH
jgi:hypothetical protein